MNTQEVAKALYTEWAARQDKLEPLNQTIDDYSGTRTRTVTIDRATIRPKWHALTAAQQDVWLSVAAICFETMEPKPVLRLHYDDRGLHGFDNEDE